MNSVDRLCDAYRRQVALPWSAPLSASERVWMALYAPLQERRLRLRLEAFANATREAGHGWRLVDLTDAFAHWMAENPYREAYFDEPDDMQMALKAFADALAARVRTELATADDACVVAISGTASLFGLSSVSHLIEAVSATIRGRLLVFFPGDKVGNNYRLLDARDGWNYLAIAIRADEGE